MHSEFLLSEKRGNPHSLKQFVFQIRQKTVGLCSGLKACKISPLYFFPVIQRLFAQLLLFSVALNMSTSKKKKEVAEARNIYVYVNSHILLVSNLLPYLRYVFHVCMCVWGVWCISTLGRDVSNFCNWISRSCWKTDRHVATAGGECCGSRRSVWSWLWALSSYWQAQSHCLWICL